MTMRKAAVLTAAFALFAAAGTGCSEKKKVRVGPLKEWIVGDWIRMDDPLLWQFRADGEMSTTGQLPVAGSYQVMEPDTVTLSVSGANAMTTSAQLGIPVEPGSQSLTITWKVVDDEMRLVGVDSKAYWKKK